jgi:hypothetical protein
MTNQIKKILGAAVHAPSGENAQPWRFSVQGNRVRVFNIPERDQSLFSFGQMASYVAHGALIENILISSAAFGYQAAMDLFPEGRNSDVVAAISLKEAPPKDEPLYPFILKRCTNRKPYKTAPLTAAQLAELVDAPKGIPGGGRVVFSQDRSDIAALAIAGSVNEQVMFDNRFLHHFFFTHINWTKEEDEKRRVGFYIDTLELPPPIKPIFKLFRFWPAIKLFNKVGFAERVAAGNAKNYASSAAMGAVIVPRNAPPDFVTAGRIMQRVWLTATWLGLSIQPLAGVLFYMQGISAGRTERFTPQQLDLIWEAYGKIRKVFGVNGESVAMMFRIGEGGEPSARASKLPAEVEGLEDSPVE